MAEINVCYLSKALRCLEKLYCLYDKRLLTLSIAMKVSSKPEAIELSKHGQNLRTLISNGISLEGEAFSCSLPAYILAVFRPHLLR
jgi:hypothetical protein